MEQYINKIIQGDNVEVMKGLPSDSIDLTVTSPPYDTIRDYEGYSWDCNAVIEQLYRITKTGGVVVWVVDDGVIDGGKSLSSFKQALSFKESGFIMHDIMIYQKTGVRYPHPNRYHSCWEFMMILSKGKPKTTNIIKDRKNTYAGSKIARPSGTRLVDGTMKENSAWRIDKDRKLAEYGARYNIWVVSAGGGHSSKEKETFKHPAVFPESLARDHIITWSNKGDVVLDPFSGSGTTAKMALLEDRKYIGIEISKEYVELSTARLQSAITQESDKRGNGIHEIFEF